MPIPTSPPPTQIDLFPCGDNGIGTDWDGCWEINDTTKTMLWIGAPYSDIGQEGGPLTKIRLGYSAEFTISVSGTLEICVGQIDGRDARDIPGPCSKQVLLQPGTHRVTNSTGNSGGFRFVAN